MSKTKQQVEPINEVRDLMRKILVLNLFGLDLPQIEIAKKLHMDTHAVNEFLKGLKKK